MPAKNTIKIFDVLIYFSEKNPKLSYQNFVEYYKPSKKEKKLIEKLMLE